MLILKIVVLIEVSRLLVLLKGYPCVHDSSRLTYDSHKSGRVAYAFNSRKRSQCENYSIIFLSLRIMTAAITIEIIDKEMENGLFRLTVIPDESLFNLIS